MAIVAGASHVPEGEIRRFEVEERAIAVARSEGEFFAFDVTCTHEGCDLVDEGEVAGRELTCLCHFSVFDLGSGEVIDGPAPQALEVFDVIVDEDLDVSI